MWQNFITPSIFRVNNFNFLFRLATWILHMNQNGFKVPDRHAINAAKLFQNISEGLDPDINYGSNPGKSWYKSFVERFSIAAHNQNSDFRKVEFSLEKVIENFFFLFIFSCFDF